MGTVLHASRIAISREKGPPRKAAGEGFAGITEREDTR